MPMHVLVRAAAAAGLLLLWSAPVPAAPPAKAGNAAPPAPVAVAPGGGVELSGRLIVRPHPTLPAANAADAVARLQPHLIRHIPEVGEYIVAVPKGTPDLEFAAQLMATGDYQYATPDWICHLAVIPNDTRYPGQWHHPIIQSPAAWNITTGSSSITCAFVDTGVDLTHPDLAAARVSGFNSASLVAEVDGGDVSDINGHGTIVSGTAAAIGNNGTGVVGVGWNLHFMMVRTSNQTNGDADMSAILAGARWAVEHGAKLASCSYSGVESPSVQTTGAYIKSIGGLLLFAAGNSSSHLGGFDYPDVIIVGATDQSDARASFSSYGPAVDCFAPGVDIFSTNLGARYGAASGTSFSTPMTAGVLGLIWSVNPSFTPAQAEFLLLYSCDDLGDPGDDSTFGHGRINSFRAVSNAVASLSPAAPVAVADTGPIAFGGDVISIDALSNDYDLNVDPLEFVTFASPTTRGGAVAISTGTGPGGRDQLVYTAPLHVSGADTFTYTIRDPGGLTGSATVTVPVYDIDTFRMPEDPRPVGVGLHVDYYALTAPSVLPNFTPLTPYASEVRPDLGIASTNGAFAGSGRSDDVGAVFTGYVYAPATDVYTFYTTSDDGSALYIGNQRIVSNDGLHGMQERSGQISLRAGYHSLRVEFFERTGGAGLIASMSSLSMPKQSIPANYLTHSTCTPDWDGNGHIDPADIAYAVTTWTLDLEQGTLYADFDHNGQIGPTDLAIFVNLWFSALATGC